MEVPVKFIRKKDNIYIYIYEDVKEEEEEKEETFCGGEAHQRRQKWLIFGVGAGGRAKESLVFDLCPVL